MNLLKADLKVHDEKIENRLKRIQKKGDQMIEEAQWRHYEAVDFLRIEKEQLLKTAASARTAPVRAEKSKWKRFLKTKQKELSRHLRFMEHFT